MNRALPGNPNVLAMRAVDAPYLAIVANNDRAVEDQAAELADAAAEWEAPMIVDALPEDFSPSVNRPAPDWRYPAREGYFDKPRKADRLPQILPQREIDDADGVPSSMALVVMFSAAASVALIIAGFDWLMGVM